MNVTAFALTIVAAFFWGFSQDISKLCVGRLNAIAFNATQYSVLAAVMTAIIALTGVETGSSWAVSMAVAFGVLWLVVGSLLFYSCLHCAPAHVVVPITSVSSIWTVLFAALLLGEGIGASIPVSLAFILVGIFLLAPRGGGGRVSKSAVLMSMAVAVTFGLNQIVRKSAMAAGMGPLTFIWISSLTGASLLILIGLLRSSFRGQRLDRFSFGISASVGLLNQLVGGGLFLLALGMESASNLAPAASATIAFGFLLAIPLLRERPTWRAAAGVVTIFAGVIIATL